MEHRSGTCAAARKGLICNIGSDPRGRPAAADNDSSGTFGPYPRCDFLRQAVGGATVGGGTVLGAGGLLAACGLSEPADLIGNGETSIVPVGFDPKKPTGTGPFVYESSTPVQRMSPQGAADQEALDPWIEYRFRTLWLD